MRALLVLAIACGHPVAPGTQPGRMTEPVVVSTHHHHPTNLVADPGNLWWIEGDRMWRAEHQTHQVDYVGLERATALAIGDYLYYAVPPAEDDDEGRGEIKKLQGLHVARTQGRVAQLAVDATHVYWTDGGGNFSSVPIAGGAATTIVASPEYSYVDELATAGGALYFSNALDDTPRRIYRLSGGAVVQVSADTPVGNWVLANGGVYYAAHGKLWRDATPLEVPIGDGAIVGALGDRVFFITDHSLRDTTGATNVHIDGEITASATAAGGLWLVRETGSDSEILYYAP